MQKNPKYDGYQRGLTYEPFEPFGGDINAEVDLSNYATKSGIKNFLHVDTSRFTLKLNLASLKTEVDKLDVDKLKIYQVI